MHQYFDPVRMKTAVHNLQHQHEWGRSCQSLLLLPMTSHCWALVHDGCYENNLAPSRHAHEWQVLCSVLVKKMRRAVILDSKYLPICWDIS